MMVAPIGFPKSHGNKKKNALYLNILQRHWKRKEIKGEDNKNK